MHVTDPTSAYAEADPLFGRIDPALMAPALGAPDRMGSIKELVDAMRKNGWVEDSLSFLQAVLEREELESTVLGDGVAFPHARSRSARRLGAAIGVSAEGINFGSPGHPVRVHLVCLIAIPAHESEAYLPFLAELSGLFTNDAFRRGLASCATPRAMFDLVSNTHDPEGLAA